MQVFESKEALQAWCEENLFEKDGGFTLKAVFDQKELDEEVGKARKGKEQINIDLKARKAELAEAKEKITALETELETHKSELDTLKESGGADKNAQAWATEKAGLNKEIKDLRAQVAANVEMGRQNESLQAQVRDYEAKDRNARIWDAIQREAKLLDVPAQVIELDLRHYTGNFEIDDDGEVVLKSDPQKTVKTAIAEMQKERPYWQQPSQGAGAEPGKSKSSGGKSLDIGDCFLANTINAPG